MSSIPISKEAELSRADKLQMALELADAGIAMRRAQLEREHPEASPAEIDTLLSAWLQHRPGAEHGDAEGRAAPDRFETA